MPTELFRGNETCSDSIGARGDPVEFLTDRIGTSGISLIGDGSLGE